MVISIVLVIVGIIVMRGLPISQFPDIVPPVIKVSTTYYGANAVDVEDAVATPIEQNVNGVENMIYMKSVNANDGTMTLYVSFDVGSNLDMSNVLTQNRVSQSNSSLPASVKNTGVNVKKSLVFPLLIVTLTSDEVTEDNAFLANYANINVIDQIKRIKGVGDVNLLGGSNYSMRIWIKPDKMGSLSLNVEDLINAVNQQNVISPAGQLGAEPAPPGTDFTYTVKTKGRLLNEEDFENIVVKTKSDGSQVKLKDVARIELGSLLYNSTGRVNGKPAGVIAVYQQPGSNSLQVAAEVKEKMKELAVSFPPGLKDEITLDTTLPVTEGINEIIHTLVEAILLVILVVFVFLQNWRATLIPFFAVPVSLIATFIVFPLLGFSINTLSLLGMVLAIGIVVDDAIVVVEAISHHIEKGLTPKEASFKAMEEVSGPVIAIALVLSAVFVPVAFLGGITGSLYQQFAVTIAISVLFSAFNALSLSPALSALLLKPHGHKKSPLQKFYDWFNKHFTNITNKYVSITEKIGRKPVTSILFVGISIFLVIILFRNVPGGFVPEEDNGYFMISVILPDASSLQRTKEVSKKVESLLKEEEEIAYYTSIPGYNFISSVYGTNNGAFFISLKPWEERKGKGQSSFELIQKLNKKLSAAIPEGITYVFGPPAIQGLGTGAGFTFMLQDKSGNTPDALAVEVNRFIQEAKKRPEIGSINSFYRANVPQMYADIDIDKIKKQGININEVNNTLATILGATYVNDFNRFGRIWNVFMSSEGDYRNEITDISKFYVKNNKGENVPLSTLVTMKKSSGPDFTNRFNLYRAAEISGTPAEGYTSAQALTALKEVAAEVIPAGYGYQWANMSYQEEAAAGSSAIVFAFALLFVFLILAAQYESWSLPVSVLLGTPFAVFGAMLGLWISRYFSYSYDVNIYAQIGFITLIGLSAKNAILIVEFAKENKEKGMPVFEAAIDGAKLRLRPILMTSFAFILGVVPLVIASGAGAVARKVMGMAVFSGLIVATVLAIFFVPAFFIFVEKYFVKEKKVINTENNSAFEIPEEGEKDDKH
jgi:HAE1 family hydrophobic/amphiphilic exporter-1